MPETHHLKRGSTSRRSKTEPSSRLSASLGASRTFGITSKPHGPFGVAALFDEIQRRSAGIGLPFGDHLRSGIRWLKSFPGRGLRMPSPTSAQTGAVRPCGCSPAVQFPTCSHTMRALLAAACSLR